MFNNVSFLWIKCWLNPLQTICHGDWSKYNTQGGKYCCIVTRYDVLGDLTDNYVVQCSIHKYNNNGQSIVFTLFIFILLYN